MDRTTFTVTGVLIFLYLFFLVVMLSSCSDRVISHDRNSHGVIVGGVPIAQYFEGDTISEAKADDLDTYEGETLANASISSVQSRQLGVVTVNFTDLINKQNHSREVFYLAGSITNYVEFVYQAGKRQRRVFYSGSGADGQWFTPDDIVGGYTDFASTVPNVRHVHYIGAGADAKWFTADDLIETYEANLLDSAGAIVGEANYNAFGTDGNWFTADDVIAWFEVKGATPQGDATWVKYLSAGADGDWTTVSDNTVAEFMVRAKNAAGNPTRSAFYTNVGPDGVPFTNDDVPQSYRTFSYDAQNVVTESIFYAGGPGADGRWFTADDIIRLCRKLENDPAGLPYRTVGTRPGVDAKCFSTDDVIRGYHQDEFNAAGAVTKSTTYTGAGADRAWFNTDDVIHSEEFFVIP